MKAKLVVTFDMVDDRGNSLLYEGYQNGFEAALNRKRKAMHWADFYMVEMALEHAIASLCSTPLECRLFPQIPGKTAPAQDNSNPEESAPQWPVFSLHSKE
jgi:hypothetical protein